MGSVASELLAERRQVGPVCGLSVFLRSMRSRPDAVEFLKAVYDRRTPASVVWRVLRKRGYRLSPWTVRAHRSYPCWHCEQLKKDVMRKETAK